MKKIKLKHINSCDIYKIYKILITNFTSSILNLYSYQYNYLKLKKKIKKSQIYFKCNKKQIMLGIVTLN